MPSEQTPSTPSPASTAPASTAPAGPPRAEKRPVRREHHGDVVVDDYEWLRDKDDADVIAHLEAENAHTDVETQHLEVLEQLVFDEISRRTKQTDLSVPVRDGGWWVYSRTVEGSQYGIRARVPVAGPDDWTPPAIPEDGSPLPGEQVLLDGNVEAEGHDFFSIGSLDTSPDGATLLWAVDTAGDERYTLRLRALDGRDAELPDEIPGTAGGAFFDATGRHVFYTTVDDAWRPDTLWRHEVGTPGGPEHDAVVLREPDERYWLGAGLTRSRRFIEIGLGSKITSESWLIDADDPTGEPRVVWPRREGVEYEVEHAVLDGADRLLVLHNDGAEDFELVSVAADDPQGAREVVVPHRPGTRLDHVQAFATHLVLSTRRDVLPRVAVARLGAGSHGIRFDELDFDEQLFDVHAAGNPEWDAPVLRLGYTSFTTPSTVLELDVATGARHVRKVQPVLGGYDPARYSQRREWATASDGTRVPISLVWRDDLVTPGEPAPLHLYGYGSYETSIDPYFSIPRLSMLERGVVFAVAHVRGGGELGRAWYEQGKTHRKRNTFTDFVAVAEHLVEQGWTSPDRLVAEGGSAGGLLMGAVANLAPGLFSGILAGVPFVDPLTSILDPELPLTVIEWDEWGNPLADPEIYALMKSYSPYENVHDTTYPPILAVTSLNDTRVLYVEPAKWVARLREVGAPALLRCEMSAGHGGVSGRYEAWRKRAFEIAWMLDRLGVHGAAAHG
jgi:oligopeptidase B